MTERSEQCRNCMWWHPNGNINATGSENTPADSNIGTCHAHPPWPFLTPAGATGSLFPKTYAGRFCREWQSRNEVPL